MLRAGLGISTLQEPAVAAEEAAALSRARLEGHDPAVSLVLASAAHGEGVSVIAECSAHALGSDVVVGASVEGIVAPGVEVSSYPAVLVLSIAGVEALPFLVRDIGGDEARAGADVAARVGELLGASDIVIALPDSLGLNAGRLAEGFAEHLAPATVLGTGAVATPRGSVVLWKGAEIANEGVSGVVLRNLNHRLVITEAGRCITPLLPVTRARGNWVLGLAGRSALDTYVAEARGRELLVGIATRDGSDDVVVRNVVGFDESRGAFSVPEPVRSGDRLAFVELDADSARQAFSGQVASLRDPAPAFGFYFNCRARGASLFGEAGVEATSLANAFADCPIAGVIGPYQLAPPQVGADSMVLTYAGALALVDQA